MLDALEVRYGLPAQGSRFAVLLILPEVGPGSGAVDWRTGRVHLRPLRGELRQGSQTASWQSRAGVCGVGFLHGLAAPEVAGANRENIRGGAPGPEHQGRYPAQPRCQLGDDRYGPGCLAPGGVGAVFMSWVVEACSYSPYLVSSQTNH